MLTAEIFEERIEALWASQKRMAAPKKWKGGKRAGSIRRPAAPIEFNKQQLREWLWQRVGLNAIPCPYCGAPIDIVSLTLDHIHPRSIGGDFSLSNMQPICKDCNSMKGDMTCAGFEKLLMFARTLSPHDQTKLAARLKAAHHGSANRFFRDKARAQVPSPSPQRPALSRVPAQPKLDPWF